VRIIGGRWRSRLIEFPGREDLRPTPDRVRETLFNWLGQDLDGLSCLDLFAGSGALGFEAASRGAARVVMVERDPAAAGALQENRARLGGDTVEIVRADALGWLDGEGRRFDVVFADPPFRQNLLPAVLARLPRRLAEGGRVYAEADHAVEEPGWRVVKHARAGQVHYQLLQPD
jgi:16S rRNA (guanine966-N2)-methyltransferase